MYWTPCAAHCIDLILEDIGKIPKIAKTLEMAIQLTDSLLNDSLAFNWQKDACSLPSAGDRSNIILGVPRSNHKERGKFKDNVKKTIWVKNKSTFA